MDVLLSILTGAPLLILFLVMAAGTILGRVSFGPVKFGAAGALFVGLAVAALEPKLGEGFQPYQALGLALFVYMIGLSAGNRFFRDIRTQYPLMIAASLILVVFAVAMTALGRVFGLDRELIAGTFTGTLTSTPALAAATRAAGGSSIPAVGYAIAYPLGVMLPMIIISLMLSIRPVRAAFTSRKDPGRPRGKHIRDRSVLVDRTIAVQDIPGYWDGSVGVTYLQRRGIMTVARTDTVLHEGDTVVVVGFPEALEEAVECLGTLAPRRLADDRSDVDYRRILVSNPHLAGRELRDTRITSRFGGVVSRVRRGDEDMVATPSTRIEMGDRLRVVAPKAEIAGLSAYLGDSEKRINHVDFLALGVGISLGLLLGLISIPLPGGGVFALGSAAGPLVVGLVFGRFEHTGKLLWTVPRPVNLTVRQLGLTLFLASVGLSSGQAFAAHAFTLDGLKVAGLAAISIVLMLPLVPLAGALLGLSIERTAGAVAAFVGQSVILVHAQNLTEDERTTSGYAALYALSIVVKLLLVQVIVV